MAETQKSGANLVIVSIIVALVSFGIGYFAGNHTKGDGVSTADTAMPGSAAAPSYVAKGSMEDSPIIPVGESPVLGNPDAPVTIVEFSDYQCPFCQRGASTLKELYQKYPNDVRIVFKNYPLPFHKEAPAASKAALAAAEQGKYWEMHDKLFDNYKKFKANASDMKSFAAGLAKDIGLDVAKFNTAFDKPEYDKMIQEDMALGGKIGVRGTPHFFINGVRISGAQPLEKFEEIFKAQLEEARKLEGAKDTYAQMVKKNYAAAEEPADQQEPPQKVTFVPVDQELDGIKGNVNDALVTIVEFSEFQCPFCKRGDATVSQVVQEYGDKVRVVFKHLPLPFHNKAEPAAKAVLAAKRQGKFWEYHDALFAKQSELASNQEIFVSIANDLGLNVSKFEADMQDPQIAKQIKDDSDLAGRIGAQGTPNFFINGVQLIGAQPFPKFKELIDAQVALAQKIKREQNLSGEALYKAVSEHNVKNAPAAPAAPARPADVVDTNLLQINGAPTKGPNNAKVKIYEFSDFQCPFCKRGADTMDEVVKEYGDKVQVVFKQNPLPFHTQAPQAHRAALAAGKQGKFWEFHDKLFSNAAAFKQGDMDALMVEYAQGLGLNVEKFKKDYNDPAVANQLKTDMEEGTKVAVQGTPHFFVNGVRVVGAQPFSKFKEVIDSELAK